MLDEDGYVEWYDVKVKHGMKKKSWRRYEFFKQKHKEKVHKDDDKMIKVKKKKMMLKNLKLLSMLMTMTSLQMIRKNAANQW